jgi:hypothetical protein
MSRISHLKCIGESVFEFRMENLLLRRLEETGNALVVQNQRLKAELARTSK